MSLKPEAFKTQALHSFILTLGAESWTQKGHGHCTGHCTGKGEVEVSIQGAGTAMGREKEESKAGRQGTGCLG